MRLNPSFIRFIREVCSWSRELLSTRYLGATLVFSGRGAWCGNCNFCQSLRSLIRLHSSHPRGVPFSHLSVPAGGQGFSVYEDMRDKLLARGVPAAEVQFIPAYAGD